jgi:crossover junction endodeoxyribonuclease RuvC
MGGAPLPPRPRRSPPRPRRWWRVSGPGGTDGRVRILGVDPGSRKTGWGVIEVHGSRLVHVDNGVLYLDPDSDLTIRLVDLCHRLKDVVTAYAPTHAAVEDVFVDKGARSALILGQARGAAVSVLGLAGLPVRSLPTSVVKQRVAGTGRASKEQIQAMVTTLLGLPAYPLEDAADALAVALAACSEGQPPAALLLTGSLSNSNAGNPARSGGARSGARAGLAALARAQGKL